MPPSAVSGLTPDNNLYPIDIYISISTIKQVCPTAVWYTTQQGVPAAANLPEKLSLAHTMD